MTKAQQEALRWLTERGGTGIFDKNGVVLACGETAPFVRSTWNALAEYGHVEFYKPTGKGRGRIALTLQSR